MKSLKSMSDEWFYAICWSYLLLGIFIIKWCVAFSLDFGLFEISLSYKNKRNIEFSSWWKQFSNKRT